MKSAARRSARVPKLVAGALAAGIALTLWIAGFAAKAGAALDDALLRAGSQALALPGVAPGERQTLRVNGTDLSYRVESVATPLSEAFSHFAEVCGGRSTRATALEPLLRALSVRGASAGDHAYVACLDLHQVGLASLAHLAQRVAKTRDLSHLGALRYVYARKDEVDPTRTLLFSMWADGPLDLRSFMLVPGSDAPGVDLRHVPRPRTSHRLLSVEQPTGGLAVYRVHERTPEAEARWFSERFRAERWIVTEGTRVESRGTVLVVAERESRTATVIFSRADGRSTLVIAHETEAS